MASPRTAACYDWVMAIAERRGLAARRRALLADARGKVLEIGAGTGASLPHYPPAVTELTLVEPNDAMRARLEYRVARTRPGMPTKVVDAVAEDLPFMDDSFDEAVVTLVLCSVDHPVGAARELRRVLRPGGLLRFVEHVPATPHGPSRLQRLVGPAHKALAGGCSLDHSMVATLRASGFEVVEIHDWDLPAAPSWVRPAVTGVARAPAPAGAQPG